MSLFKKQLKANKIIYTILGIKITLPANRNNKTFKPKFLIEKTPINKFQPEAENDLYKYWLENTKKDIDKWHHYFPIYHKHFAKYKNKPVNILEIGVFKGGSLRMWKDFFGKEAKIFGVDISPECKKFEDKENDINIFIGDQNDPKFLKDLIAKVPKIDIFIDDGGHTTSQQITTFLECYDKIADDGIYLCEDLHTNYWKNFIDSKETFVDFAKKHVDGLNAWFYAKNSDDWYNKKKEIAEMPVFTNITHSVTFYNSIIVFEKQKTCLPVSELK